MATSGWQNEQTWFTYSSHIRLIGNIRVDGITHSGSNLRVWGQIAAGARGDSGYSFYYSDYTSYAQPEGGNKIALGDKGRSWRVGAGDVYVNFDVTIGGVPASSTSRSFFVNFYGPNTSSVKATLRWNLSFDASGSAPSGNYANYISSTYDSIKANVGVSSWGGLSGQRLEAIMVTGSGGDIASFNTITADNWTSKGRLVWQRNTTNLSETIDMLSSNVDLMLDGAINFTGMRRYYLASWAVNAVGGTGAIDMTIRYLPPAPCTMTYTDPGGEGTKVYTVTFTGDASRNSSVYESENLTRTVRYKVNNAAEWTYVEEDVVKAVDANTEFTVSVPGSQTAVIEGWMTYHGMQSEVKTVNIFNGNLPSRVYGSVNGESKLLYKMYGSVDGQSVEIVKLYGSVDGKAKPILG